MWLNKEKLAKNTSIYQNLVVFSGASISFLKTNVENTLKSSSIFFFFFFLSLWLKSHKIAIKKNLQRNLQIMSSNTKLKFIKKK